MQTLRISCSELNRGTGAALEKSKDHLVILEKRGEPHTVFMSYKQYEKLSKKRDKNKIADMSFLDDIEDLLNKKFSQIKEELQLKLDEIPKRYGMKMVI